MLLIFTSCNYKQRYNCTPWAISATNYSVP